MNGNKVQAICHRLSSSLSPTRSEMKNGFEECQPVASSAGLQVAPEETEKQLNEGGRDEIFSKEDRFLIYDRNLFRFKVCVVVLLYMSRSIIETRHVVSNLDVGGQRSLKNLYEMIFFACIFAFVYVSGKSFATSLLTLETSSSSDQRHSGVIRVLTHPGLSSLKHVVYKSLTKYFLPGFAILYFIQPFSYYISKGHPKWTERVTLSPINFYLDSLDRIIYRATLDTTSRKISYFPQVLIYLSVIRIIYFPVTELTKYIIECSFGKVKSPVSKNCPKKEGDSHENGHLNSTNSSNEISTTSGRLSVVLDIPDLDSLEKKHPLLVDELRRVQAGEGETSGQEKCCFHGREFSFVSLFGKATVPILIILMLHYFKLAEFSMLIFIPIAIPTITFSLAGHLSPVNKVQISLALTYSLLFFLLIPLNGYSLIWKLCLVFILGVTNTQLSFMRSQHSYHLSKRKSADIIHPLLKSVSLIVFSVTIIYLAFLNPESKHLSHLSSHLNLLREISLLFLIITFTSHPLFTSQPFLLDKPNADFKIRRENQNIAMMILLHPISVRIVSFFFQSKQVGLPLYTVISAITIFSILLTQLLFYLLLSLWSCVLFLKSLIKPETGPKGYFFLNHSHSPGTRSV